MESNWKFSTYWQYVDNRLTVSSGWTYTQIVVSIHFNLCIVPLVWTSYIYSVIVFTLIQWIGLLVIIWTKNKERKKCCWSHWCSGVCAIYFHRVLLSKHTIRIRQNEIRSWYRIVQQIHEPKNSEICWFLSKYCVCYHLFVSEEIVIVNYVSDRNERNQTYVNDSICFGQNIGDSWKKKRKCWCWFESSDFSKEKKEHIH